MTSREQICAALFALGEGMTWSVDGGVTTSSFASAYRRVKLWDEPGANLPMLCQAERDETPKKVRTGMPSVNTMMFTWLIYFAIPNDSDFVPGTTANAILDQIDAMFPGAEDGPGFGLADLGDQTLGGLVYRVRVLGKITKWLGDLGGVALLMVPIEVIIP